MIGIKGQFSHRLPFLRNKMTIEIVLIMILLPIFAFYGGFMIGGLIFAISKEIRAVNERRKPKK